MTFGTRTLTGRLLAQRYRVGELSREDDLVTQFQGEDTRTGSAVNVEVVREGLGAESGASRTLELEAMHACEIRHPGVVTPRDVGVLEDGSVFVVTTRLPGETLDDRVCVSGGLPVGDVVRIGLDLLSVLAAAHDLGIVHGDLRPEHVFLVERDGHLLQTLASGFGRGRGARDRKALTLSSAAFVAPEVAMGEIPTEASDVYAVAAILYLAATGFPPYAGASVFRPEIPARLVRVLAQAMEPDPSRRFASARDMLHALDIVRGAFGSAYRRGRPASGTFTAPGVTAAGESDDLDPPETQRTVAFTQSGFMPSAKSAASADATTESPMAYEPPRFARSVG